jgi:hypothetical protein
MMEHIGMKPERLRIAFMTAADGQLLAEVTDDFTRQVMEMGPLGQGEGLDMDELKFKLDAARKLVPYMRLVERERLRAPKKTKEAYKDFFESSEVNALIDEILSEKFAVSEIMSLLKEKPLSTSDISERLGLSPSDVSRHMISSSRHGMVQYDTATNCYALA